MKKNNITFTLNNSEKIVISLETPLNDVHCCYYDATIFFVHDETWYILSDHAVDSVRINVESFRNLLFKALENRLPLDPCLEADSTVGKGIGYAYNEYRQDKPDVIYEEGADGKMWVGGKYLLWGSSNIAWIYNDNEGNIVLEITPTFPGLPTVRDPNTPLSPEQITNARVYEEWIKNYTRVSKIIIPRDVAERWFKQANNLLAVIDENTARMKREYEENQR